MWPALGCFHSCFLRLPVGSVSCQRSCPGSSIRTSPSAGFCACQWVHEPALAQFLTSFRPKLVLVVGCFSPAMAHVDFWLDPLEAHSRYIAWAQRGGTVVKVLTLHTRDPIWAPVLSRQPCFPSSSLPVARESSRGRPKALGPARPPLPWETRKRLLASDRQSIGPLRSLGE